MLTEAKPADYVNRKFVCIFGQKENGKSTFAGYLKNAIFEQSNKVFAFRHFASPLRETVCNLMGLTKEEYHHYKNVDTPPPGMNVPVRYLAIEIAKVCRSAKETCFIDKVIYNLYDNWFIVDDGRFENELAASRNAGGYNIFLTRPEKAVYAYRGPMDETEQFCGRFASYVNDPGKDGYAIPGKVFHSIIVNNSTLVDLQSAAEQLAYKIVNTYLAAHWPAEK